MKEKYVKLESVLAALYSNKKNDNNGNIDSKAITDILALPTEEIKTIEVNQNSNILNNCDDWSERLNELLKELNPPYDNYWTLLNGNSYIPEHCKTCSNHPSNGGPGNCNCILGSPVTYVGN